MEKKGCQHKDFPSGPPPQYQPRLKPLNFGVQYGRQHQICYKLLDKPQIKMKYEQIQQQYSTWTIILHYTLIVIVVLIAYYVLYVRRGIKFPEQESDIKIDSLFRIFKLNLSRIYYFDQDYYVNACGIEAYQYLFFQRKMLLVCLINGLVTILFILLVPGKKSWLYQVDKDFSPMYQYVTTLVQTFILFAWVKISISEIYDMNTGQLDEYWIQQQILLIRASQTNVSVDQIKNEIQKYLDTNENFGKVVEILEMPLYPMKKLAQIRRNQIYGEFKQQLCINCYQPKFIQQPQMQNISGHFFALFDTDAGRNAILNHFNSQSAHLNCFKIVSEPICGQLSNIENPEFYFLVQESPIPLDFYYTNLYVNAQSYICRKLTAGLFMLLILIFCTTPSSVISYFKFEIFEVHVISLITLSTINQILLFFIDLSAKLERHISKSEYQRSVYKRSVFYLTMNMLIVPALSFVAFNNIYDLIINNVQDFMDIIQAAYFLNNSQFFVLLVFQLSCLSLISLLRLDEIFTSWLSAAYADYKRINIEKYFQDMNDMFNYGYYYGQQITVLYIVYTFSTNIPIINIMGVLYYFCKHFVDSLNLLTVFNQEINSKNKLIFRAVQSSLWAIVPLQVLGLVIYILESNKVFILLSVIMIMAQIIGVVYFDKLITDKQTIFLEQIKMLYSGITDPNYLHNKYRHPLQ
ncbi:hypothetical protein pb186bvf_005293 [Paramecium bursaria]